MRRPFNTVITCNYQTICANNLAFKKVNTKYIRLVLRLWSHPSANDFILKQFHTKLFPRRPSPAFRAAGRASRSPAGPRRRRAARPPRASQGAPRPGGAAPRRSAAPVPPAFRASVVHWAKKAWSAQCGFEKSKNAPRARCPRPARQRRPRARAPSGGSWRGVRASPP